MINWIREYGRLARSSKLTERLGSASKVVFSLAPDPKKGGTESLHINYLCPNDLRQRVKAEMIVRGMWGM
jgi:hypothetical protein